EHHINNRPGIYSHPRIFRYLRGSQEVSHSREDRAFIRGALPRVRAISEGKGGGRFEGCGGGEGACRREGARFSLYREPRPVARGIRVRREVLYERGPRRVIFSA